MYSSIIGITGLLDNTEKNELAMLPKMRIQIQNLWN